ncbi:FAD-binding oxidoreductase [Novosphingobium panipatense]|uniref:FAD-binding oxidoreductase n=1 Tax=Novosphingobium TaxID=165696 RepID=UPI000CDAF536|nr:FAD-binding oxidoreductase [Novosphingobium sp. HII-3]
MISNNSSARVSLSAIVGADNLLTEPARISYFATDVYRSQVLPGAVVRPGTVEELQAVVREAAAANVRFTVRGGGASYTDGYNAVDGSHLLIDMSRLNRIVEIDEFNGYVTVEAGVTWLQLSDALAAKGLRTPFRGPFSGIAATVGGSMSQNSISHGSGAWGISAESALAFDIVLADGRLLRTGTGGMGEKPFGRHAGPDLTGLFTGDCGVFGLKARVTLPLLRNKPAHRVLSFAFAEFAQMHESMRRIAMERVEDSHFALDAALSQGQIAKQERAGGQLAMALSIVKSSPSVLAGLRQVAAAGVLARRQISASNYMTHYIVEGFDDAECRARLQRLRDLTADLGREIVATVPSVVRGMPFAPLYNTLGPNGERWVPLHGVMAHDRVRGFHEALQSFYAERAADMKQHGVWGGGMYSTVGSSGFLYEIALYWPDEQTAYHAESVPADYLASLPTFPANLPAREFVHRLKGELVDLYDAHGALHFQLGRAYPYASRLAEEPRALVKAIKSALDPKGLVGPGVLGL